MHRHSQGDEDRMEFGEGTTGGNAAHDGPAAAAEGAGRPQGEPEIYVDPTRIDGLPQFGCSDDDNEGDLGESSFWKMPMGIIIPTLPKNFTIKQGFIADVRKHKFHGRPGEDPLGHLDTFSRLCVVYNVANTPLDDVRMALFPFSLADKATEWEQGTPSEFVSKWDDVRREFLNAFFPKEETAKFRGFIASFKQGNHESFTQAWGRMKRYVRMCPHHGFSKKLLFKIFYQGCSENNRMHLDAASKGRFVDVDIKESERLVAILASGGSQDYDSNFKLGETGTEAMEEVFAKFKQKLNDIFDKNFPSKSTTRSELRGNKRKDRERSEDDTPNSPIDSASKPISPPFQQKPPYRNLESRMDEDGLPPFRERNGATLHQNERNPHDPGDAHRGYTSSNPSWSNEETPSVKYNLREARPDIEDHEIIEFATDSSIAIGRKRIKTDETGRRVSLSWEESDLRTSQFRSMSERYEDQPQGKYGKRSTKEFCQFTEGGAGRHDTRRPRNPGDPDDLSDDLGREDSVNDETQNTKEGDGNYQGTGEVKRFYDSFPGDYNESQRRQTEGLKKVCQALSIIGDSSELNYLLKQDKSFQTRYVKMLLYVEWYETLRIPEGADQPPSRLGIKEVRAASQGKGKSKSAAIYSAPCLIRDVPFTRSTLNVLSDWNIMSLTAFRDLGTIPLKKFCRLPSPGNWIKRRPVGTAKKVVVSFQGLLIETDFLVLDTGPYGKKKIVFGRPLLAALDGSIDGSTRVITYKGSKDGETRRIWHDPHIEKDGNFVNRTLIPFYKDLAHMGSEQGWNMGYREQDPDEDEIDGLLVAKMRFRDKFRFAEGVSDILQARLIRDSDLEISQLQSENADSRASTGKTSCGQSGSVEGEIQQSPEQSPERIEGTDIPRGDEIEPGDAGTQRQESPPPSS